MGWLRGNLHAHTTYSDGVKTPQELLVEYEALGYDFLAITDHDDLICSSFLLQLPLLRPRLLPFHGGLVKDTRFRINTRAVLRRRAVPHSPNHPARVKYSMAEVS